jgi:hypothetical protein
MKGQHRVRLGDKCGMSSMHFSLRQATEADGRKITIRQAVVNFTGWQVARPEEEIFRAETSDDGYQIRAKEHLERGESIGVVDGRASRDAACHAGGSGFDSRSRPDLRLVWKSCSFL